MNQRFAGAGKPKTLAAVVKKIAPRPAPKPIIRIDRVAAVKKRK